MRQLERSGDPLSYDSLAGVSDTTKKVWDNGSTTSGLRSVFLLSQDAVVLEGDGSSNNPYIIGLLEEEE